MQSNTTDQNRPETHPRQELLARTLRGSVGDDSIIRRRESHHLLRERDAGAMNSITTEDTEEHRGKYARQLFFWPMAARNSATISCEALMAAAC